MKVCLPDAKDIDFFLRECDSIFKIMHRSQLELPFLQTSSQT